MELDNDLEQAQLESYISQYNAAKATYDRYAALMSRNSVSKEAFDQAKYAAENLRASVKSARATIERRKIVAHITAIESEINATTGLINVEAVFGKDGNTLFSGMYSRVRVALAPIEKQLIIPQVAISFALAGDSVYVVHDLAIWA